MTADELFSLALDHQNAGRLQEAVNHYVAAIGAQPTFAIAYNNLGNVLVRMNKPDQAMEAYDRALKINPKYAEALNNKGSLLHLLRRYQEAELCFHGATFHNPEYVEAYINLGAVLQEQGQIRLAIKTFDIAIHLDPNNTIARSNRLMAMHYIADDCHLE